MLSDTDLMESWREWQRSVPGLDAAEREWDVLNEMSDRLHGRFLVQLGEYGSGNVQPEFASIRRRFVADGMWKEGVALLSEGEQLPIAANSVNAVLLPHTLELAKDPHAVLREAERILIPGGYLLLTVFNPFSLYGLWRIFAGRRRFPWRGRFLMSARVQDWLKLLGFSIEALRHAGYRPPLGSPALYGRLRLMESLGAKFWPVASNVYIIQAVKRGIPLTLIGKPWKQSKRFLPGHAIEPTTRNDSSA